MLSKDDFLEILRLFPKDLVKSSKKPLIFHYWKFTQLKIHWSFFTENSLIIFTENSLIIFIENSLIIFTENSLIIFNFFTEISFKF